MSRRGQPTRRTTGTIIEPEPEKPQYQITIQKHETGYVANTLQGAKFKLYEYVSKTDTWVQIDAAATPSTEDIPTDDGVIQLCGLKPYLAYMLVESEAPGGYVKSNTPFYFWIKAEQIDTSEQTDTSQQTDTSEQTNTKLSAPDDFRGQMILPGNTLYVPNDKIEQDTTGGYELPETGGSGTQVYILAGMMLILASIVLLYNQNRHRRGNV